MTLSPLFSALGSFLVSLIILIGILKSPIRACALDVPNERSLHSKPISRLGGVAIIGGVLTALLWVGDIRLLFAVAALSAISLLDDVRGLKASVRLVVHTLVIGSYYWISYNAFVPVIILVALAAFAIWLTNLYNFMDGIDGLAGGMAVAGFAAYAAGFFIAGESGWAIIALSIASAAAAFLWFNFHPATIYMGDAGSIALGFLAAALGTAGWALGAWPIWFPLLVFSAFIADASVTLARRAVHGEKVWLPHREHYYQKLALMGVGHKKTALLEYAVIAASCAFALFGLSLPGHLQWLIFIIAAALYGIFFMNIESKWQHFQNE